MKIHEYQAKEILKRYDVPVPVGFVTEKAGEVKKLVKQLPTKVSVIKAQIQYSIERFEPRVRYVDCVVSPDEDNGALDVTLTYEIIGLDIEPQDLQFILQPTR